MFVEKWLRDTLDLDRDAGLDIGELLVATLKPERVQADVEYDDELNHAPNLQVENCAS